MGYVADTFVAGEVPTTSKWNELWSNDASFHDFSGIANSVIGPNYMNLSPASGDVATSETTASTSFTDLATVQSATVTIGVNGLALLIANATVSNTTTGANIMCYVLSGANTVAASDTNSAQTNGFSSSQNAPITLAKLFTGLTAGSTTFKIQYRVTSGTMTAFRRTLMVVPL